MPLEKIGLLVFRRPAVARMMKVFRGAVFEGTRATAQTLSKMQGKIRSEGDVVIAALLIAPRVP